MIRHIPNIIFDSKGDKWILKDAELDEKLPLMYFRERDPCGAWIKPSHVETDFTKEGRPTAKGKICIQDKWSCAAEALAMIANEHPFFVKQAMGRNGWRNDSSGASDKVLVEAARLLGRDLMYIEPDEINENIGPALVTVRSLNYPKMAHALAWNGKEMLDPNTGRPGRKFYGPEWAPWTIKPLSAMVLLERRLHDWERKGIENFKEENSKKAAKKLRREIIQQLGRGK